MNRDKPTSATMAKIAIQAGCSKNTVSLALRDSPRVSAQTRRRVQAIAKQVGYVPVHAAVQLTTQRSGMVGLYTRSLGDSVRTEMANRLIARIHSAGYQPVLGLGDGIESRWQESPWMNSFRALRVEALVILIDRVGDLPSWFGEVPTIFAGCHPPRIRECDYVALDRTEAARLGIDHLVDQGCRSVAVVAPRGHEFGGGARRRLAQRGVAALDIPIHDQTPDEAVAIARQLRKASSPPDGVIVSDAGFAAAFLRGIGTPRRVRMRVIAYDFFPWADDLRTPLSTVEQPIARLADAAMELVQRRLDDPGASFRHIKLRHSLAIRRSSGY